MKAFYTVSVKFLLAKILKPTNALMPQTETSLSGIHLVWDARSGYKGLRPAWGESSLR